MITLANKECRFSAVINIYAIYHFSTFLMGSAELTKHCEKFWDGAPVCQHGIDLTLEISNLDNLIIWRRKIKMSNKVRGKLYFNESRIES